MYLWVSLTLNVNIFTGNIHHIIKKAAGSQQSFWGKLWSYCLLILKNTSFTEEKMHSLMKHILFIYILHFILVALLQLHCISLVWRGCTSVYVVRFSTLWAKPAVWTMNVTLRFQLNCNFCSSPSKEIAPQVPSPPRPFSLLYDGVYECKSSAAFPHGRQKWKRAWSHLLCGRQRWKLP